MSLIRVASREWDHPICCSFNIGKDPLLPSIQQLANVLLIYILFASLDHNKISFFTCCYASCYLFFHSLNFNLSSSLQESHLDDYSLTRMTILIQFLQYLE